LTETSPPDPVLDVPANRSLDSTVDSFFSLPLSNVFNPSIDNIRSYEQLMPMLLPYSNSSFNYNYPFNRPSFSTVSSILALNNYAFNDLLQTPITTATLEQASAVPNILLGTSNPPDRLTAQEKSQLLREVFNTIIAQVRIGS
jgi:hypothetical protein